MYYIISKPGAIWCMRRGWWTNGHRSHSCNKMALLSFFRPCLNRRRLTVSWVQWNNVRLSIKQDSQSWPLRIFHHQYHYCAVNSVWASKKTRDNTASTSIWKKSFSKLFGVSRTRRYFFSVKSSGDNRQNKNI